jgi:hypothetical protein
MSKKTPWSAEDEDALREKVAEGLTAPQIARAQGRTLPSVQNKMRSMGLYSQSVRGVPTLTRVVSETPERVVIAPEESDEEPIADLLARAIRQTGRAVQRAQMQRHAVARLVTSRPIGIAFASDQHLSTSAATDVEKAFADAEVVQQEPGLFCILGGDGADNHIKHRAALVGKSSAPPDEWRLYEHYIATMGQKVLAVISGNHDDWTRDFAGVDMVAHLAARQRVHYSPDEIVLDVELLPSARAEPSARYTAKVRHQYRFNSALNVGHTVKRMYDMGGDPFDVGVVCHNHEAHVESFERHGRTRWAVRPGSYQIQTSHGRRYGYSASDPTCPVAIFWPDEHRVVCFRDLREGITHLRAARAEYERAAA